jgi:hypothetical protein
MRCVEHGEEGVERMRSVVGEGRTHRSHIIDQTPGSSVRHERLEQPDPILRFAQISRGSPQVQPMIGMTLEGDLATGIESHAKRSLATVSETGDEHRAYEFLASPLGPDRLGPSRHETPVFGSTIIRFPNLRGTILGNRCCPNSTASQIAIRAA